MAYGGGCREAVGCVGDTVNLHGPEPDEEARQPGGKRRVELVVNGRVAATTEVERTTRSTR